MPRRKGRGGFLGLTSSPLRKRAYGKFPRVTALSRSPGSLAFLWQAVRHQYLPEKITLDQSGANTAAIEALVEETGQKIEIRQNKYLNNLVEQDHRAVKR